MGHGKWCPIMIIQHWNHETLFNETYTEDRLRNELSEFDIRTVLAFASLVGVSLQLWTRNHPTGSIYLGFVRLLFPDSVVKTIASSQEYYLFSRRQLLLLQRIALEECDMEAGRRTI